VQESGGGETGGSDGTLVQAVAGERVGRTARESRLRECLRLRLLKVEVLLERLGGYERAGTS